MNTRFARNHPAVTFLWFCCVLGGTLLFRHPLVTALSFVCGALCSFYGFGRAALRPLLFFYLPAALLTALLNPVFSHEGVTVLCFLPWGNPLTLESIFYGISAGFTFAASMLWFRLFTAWMPADRLLTLFSRVMPSVTMLLLTALRFVPQIAARAKEIAQARQGIAADKEDGTLRARLRAGARIFSGLLDWSFLHAAETADSMRCRGWGAARRTAYSPWKFQRADIAELFLILLLVAVPAALGGMGALDWRWYPSVVGMTDYKTVLAAAAWGVLLALPMLSDRMEIYRWRSSLQTD